jgi:hypothetical protein
MNNGLEFSAWTAPAGWRVESRTEGRRSGSVGSCHISMALPVSCFSRFARSGERVVCSVCTCVQRPELPFSNSVFLIFTDISGVLCGGLCGGLRGQVPGWPALAGPSPFWLSSLLCSVPCSESRKFALCNHRKHAVHKSIFLISNVPQSRWTRGWLPCGAKLCRASHSWLRCCRAAQLDGTFHSLH